MLSVTVLSVVKLSTAMLNIIALKVVMLSGVIQSVVLLIVIAPSFEVCIVTNQAVVNSTKPFFFATDFFVQ